LLVRFQFEVLLGAALEPCEYVRGDLQALGLYLPLVIALF
jgi:hypothetical protein